MPILLQILQIFIRTSQKGQLPVWLKICKEVKERKRGHHQNTQIFGTLFWKKNVEIFEILELLYSCT